MKKYLNRFWLAAIVFLFSAELVFGQTKALSEVTVNIQSGTFTGSAGLPFDVPFKITGTVPGTIQKIMMQYRVNPDDCKKWMQDGASNWSNLVIWNNFGASDPTKDQTFYLPCGALYPNIRYDFKFYTYHSPVVTATQILALKQALYNLINDFAVNHAKGDIGSINGQLNDLLKKTAGPATGIKTANGDDYVMDLTDSDLGPLSSQLMDAASQIEDANTNINSAVIHYNLENKAALLADLKTILANPATSLNGASVAAWNAPVAAAVTDYKTTTYADVATLLNNPALDVTMLFQGKRKLDGQGLTAITAYDAGSLAILDHFFAGLVNLKKAADNSAYFSGPEAATIVHLHNYVLGAISANDSLAQYSKVKADLLTNFPDLLSDKFLYNAYVIQDQPTIDVTATQNAYIGLDYGIVYAANYGQLFFYEGVNFYFVPVNKDAPLSSIHGFWRNVGKRVSIHMGLTQDIIDNPDKHYQALLKGTGSLLVGAGCRFNRIMRLNVGALFFYESDLNPLVDHNNLMVRPAFSLTFDLNVAKALGAFGTAIGIK